MPQSLVVLLMAYITRVTLLFPKSCAIKVKFIP